MRYFNEERKQYGVREALRRLAKRDKFGVAGYVILALAVAGTFGIQRAHFDQEARQQCVQLKQSQYPIHELGQGLTAIIHLTQKAGAEVDPADAKAAIIHLSHFTHLLERLPPPRKC